MFSIAIYLASCLCDYKYVCCNCSKCFFLLSHRNGTTTSPCYMLELYTVLWTPWGRLTTHFTTSCATFNGQSNQAPDESIMNRKQLVGRDFTLVRLPSDTKQRSRNKDNDNLPHTANQLKRLFTSNFTDPRGKIDFSQVPGGNICIKS